MWGIETSSASAPSATSRSTAARTAASTSGATPWAKNSRGTPSFSPFTSGRSACM